MKTVTIEMDETPTMTARINQRLARSLTRVSRLTKSMLEEPELVAKLSSSNAFTVPQLQRGTNRLALLGDAGPSLTIGDDLFLLDVQLAVCLAARKRDLDRPQRLDIMAVLGFVGGMLQMWIMPGDLPAWGAITHKDQPERAKEIYEKLRSTSLRLRNQAPITVHEALLLRLALQPSTPPTVLSLRRQLDEVTHDHRQALAHVLRGMK